MGNIEDDGSGILHVRKTPALNRFLFFLNDCASQGDGDIDYSELKEIKDIMPDNERHTFHLILSSCLEDEELQQIFSSDRTEAMFTNVSFIMNDDEMERLSKEMYVDIVVGLDLIEDCLCMILAGPRLKIMPEIAELLTGKLTQVDVATTISLSLFDSIMTGLVKLSMMEDEEFGSMYRKSLTSVAQIFVTSELPKIGSCEKLVAVFRLIGISMLQEEDYHTADELSVLLGEWKFDNSVSFMKSVSMKIYEALLNTKSNSLIQKRLDYRTFTTLDKFLALITVDNCDKNFEESITVSSKEIPLSSYLGGCAYLMQMIMKRRNGIINAVDLPNTLKCIENFVDNKPKMKHEEVIEDIKDFYHFCENMRKYGNRDIYKKDWATKFLSFSSEEIMGTPEGNAIVEEFIIGAQYNLIVEFIKKVQEVDKLVLEDFQKDLIIRTLTLERSGKGETQDFIKQLFCDAANDKLTMESFKLELHTLSLQLGHIEFEKEASKLDMHELAILRLCLQDPVTTVGRILEQSVRTEHFRALEFTSPFFLLPLYNAHEESTDTEAELPSVLIVHCFLKLLKHFPQYPNSLYDSLSSNMEFLISRDIINETYMYLVLKYRIFKLLKGSSNVALSEVLGLMSLLESLIKLVPADNSITKDVCGIVVNLNRFFCLYTNSKTFVDVVKIKSILSRILKDLIRSQILKFPISQYMQDEIDDLSLFDQGLLYVRYDHLKPLVKNILSHGTDELSFKDFVEIIVTLILNCSEEEWNSLTEFIFNVAMSPTSKLFKVAKVSEAYLLNDVLLCTHLVCKEVDCYAAFLHALRFYGFAVECIQGKFAETEWYSLFDTLLNIALEIRRPSNEKIRGSRETVGLYQVLSYLLSKVEDFSNRSTNLSKCNELISKLGKLPQLDIKCEPVRWLISEKFKHLQSSCSA